MIIKSGALFLIILFHLTAAGQSEEEKSLPENFWELMGTCVNSEKFDFLRAHFGEPDVDAFDNLVFREFDYSIEFFFRPETRHLNQIRVDLDYYDGPDILGLKKHVSRRQMKKMLQPVQVLNYGSGSYMIGEHYSILATFEGWPVRKLIRFTVIYEGDYVPDRDMDGVADSLDHCPDEVGTEACGGCPATYCMTLPDTFRSQGFVSAFCRLLDTLSRMDTDFERMISGPATDRETLPHHLTPHKLYVPAITAPYFENVFIVEAVADENDTVFTLELITGLMPESTAEALIQKMKDTIHHCGHLHTVLGWTEKIFMASFHPSGSAESIDIMFRAEKQSGTDRYRIIVIFKKETGN